MEEQDTLKEEILESLTNGISSELSEEQIKQTQFVVDLISRLIDFYDETPTTTQFEKNYVAMVKADAITTYHTFKSFLNVKEGE